METVDRISHPQSGLWPAGFGPIHWAPGMRGGGSTHPLLNCSGGLVFNTYFPIYLMPEGSELLHADDTHL